MTPTTAPPLVPGRDGARRRVGAALPIRLATRWWPAASELALALGAALLFTWWARTIHDNPINRVGQVSGLAALQYRLAVCALPLAGVVAWASLRYDREARALTVRLAAAAAAGLFGGFLGGGQVFTLRGTPWALAGELGDNGRLIEWTQEVLRTGTFDSNSLYPPGIPHAAAFIARHFEHGNAAMAFKPLFIPLMALTPGLVYVTWRMVLRPLPALAVAVFSALSAFLPYKPYDLLAMLVLVPVIAKLAQWLKASPGFTLPGAALRGVWLGVMAGAIFSFYSGWHVWSAPGTVVMLLLIFPWRRAGGAGRLCGGALLLGCVVGFAPVGVPYLVQVLGSTGVKDTWCSQITQTDPAWIGQRSITMAQWQFPGSWPPPGEIAGLGLFALALVAGLGVAVALGLRTPAVATALACFASCWLLRFYLAHNMEKTGTVQLFPHTTFEIQYTLIVLTVLACALASERLRDWAQVLARSARQNGITLPRGAGVRFGELGALLALLLVGGMGGSFLTDRFLPASPALHTAGYVAWEAHNLRTPDGTCPTYADMGTCATPPVLKPSVSHVTGPLVCRNLYAQYEAPMAGAGAGTGAVTRNSAPKP
ncbi:hypothetical protein GCM10027517_07660 [Phycicoccus ginsengisoli]